MNSKANKEEKDGGDLSKIIAKKKFDQTKMLQAEQRSNITLINRIQKKRKFVDTVVDHTF